MQGKKVTLIDDDAYVVGLAYFPSDYGNPSKSIGKVAQSFTMKGSQLYNCKLFSTIIQQLCWYNVVGKPVMENSM